MLHDLFSLGLLAAFLAISCGLIGVFDYFRLRRNI